MRHLTKRMILAINRMSAIYTGGLCRDRGNLRPGASLAFVERIVHNEVFGQPIYPDLYHQAAAYLFHVVKDHPFLDGNKRTGLACALTFLQWNGIGVAPLDEDAVFDFVVSVASGPNHPETEVPRIAAWLREMSIS
ncbi:type II toxin-antitoxin system death-on-curing family toxin [Myxococcota bacterium]|nr:type II toxin-antitoxin system death-on-curing family toxin [Myxococcota bacterium]